MERVQRWREPAVVVVGVVVLVRLVLLAGAALSAVRTTGGITPEVVNLAGRQLGEPTLYVVLAALVLACHLRPATPHARTLTVLALVISALGLLLAIGLAVLGAPDPAAPRSGLELADRLAGAVVPLLAVVLLGLLATRPRPAPAEQPALTESAAEPAAAPEPEPPAPDPELQPTWAPDVASGAAWTTAGEAASGRPASGWGTPAGTGWDAPRPQPTSAANPRPGLGDRESTTDDAGPETPARP